MDNEVTVQHVAVECIDQESADRFFTGVLGMPKVKHSMLSEELSREIFKMDKSTIFDLYDNGKIRIEVFINDKRKDRTYTHIGIEVDDKHDFITRCQRQGLEPFFVDKNGKQLLFVRDFSDNLFEVLERWLNLNCKTLSLEKMKNDLIEKFLDKRRITSPNTRKSYRLSIENYFKLIDEDMNTYFNNGHTLEKYEDDLNKVYMIHERNKKPYLSRKVYFSGVKQYMTSNSAIRSLFPEPMI